MLLIKRIILTLLLCTLFSCSRYIGYGVIMLPDEENKEATGTLINITKESRIRETWVYNSEEEDHIEIKKWRVIFFNKKEEALSYIDKYLEYKDYYVIVKKDGHNMRAYPKSGEDNLVYKLKNNQKVKVIGRTEKKEKIARFEGYWWELITEGGTRGWAYDSYLNVYNGDKLIHGKTDEDGPEVIEFFKKTWRQAYFRTMAEKQQINTDKFKTKFKLTPDMDNKKITISTPEHYITESFTKINKTGVYNYELEGSSISLDFSRKGSVYVSYTHEYKFYNQEFVHISDSVINEIIRTEKSKREISFSEFLLEGPRYKSKVYGEIIFSDGNKFQWNDKENLIAKQLLTPRALSEGTVSFKYFLDKSLTSKYDGIITFDFGARQELSFFYSFEDEGVRFLFIPQNKIKNRIVRSDNFFTPIPLFFTGQF